MAALAQQAPPSLSVAEQLREAARLDEAGRCEEAEAIYSRLLARGGPTPPLLNNAGNHYLRCGKPEQARALFEQLLRQQPAHANANLQVGSIAAARGDFARAAAAFERVVSANPADPAALTALGKAAARSGNYRRAIEALEGALRLRPGEPAIILELGLANAAAGNSPRAVFFLAQAHSHAPSDPGIALALARAAEDAGFYGDAALAYSRYLAQKPDDIAARRDAARVTGLTPGRAAEGLQALEAHLAAHPTDAAAHFYLAQLCWSADAARALAELAEAVRLHPRLAPAHVARAWLLHRLGRDTEALAHLETALRVTPNDPRALDQLGLVQLSLDRTAAAEISFRRAARLAPQDAGIALHLGRALMSLGRETEARQWLAKYQSLRPARQRDPRREPGLIEAAALPDADRRARQIERYRSLAAARPDDPLLTLNLARLLSADGRRDEAAAEFAKLAAMNADGAIWQEAGRELMKSGDAARARAFFEKSGARLDLALAIAEADGAEAGLQALAAAGDSPDTALARALLLHRAGRAAEAREWLSRALAQSPSSRPDLVRPAAELLLAERRFADASKLLTSAVRAAPDDSDLALLSARAAALHGETGRALQLYRAIETRWPEWDQPYLAHAELLTSLGRAAEAAEKRRAAAAVRQQ